MIYITSTLIENDYHSLRGDQMENKDYIELDVREDLILKKEPFDRIMRTIKNLTLR